MPRVPHDDRRAQIQRDSHLDRHRGREPRARVALPGGYLGVVHLLQRRRRHLARHVVRQLAELPLERTGGVDLCLRLLGDALLVALNVPPISARPLRRVGRHRLRVHADELVELGLKLPARVRHQLDRRGRIREAGPARGAEMHRGLEALGRNLPVDHHGANHSHPLREWKHMLIQQQMRQLRFVDWSIGVTRRGRRGGSGVRRGCSSRCGAWRYGAWLLDSLSSLGGVGHGLSLGMWQRQELILLQSTRTLHTTHQATNQQTNDRARVIALA